MPKWCDPMPIKSVLMLSGLFLAATIVLYFSGRAPRHTRVFVASGMNQSEAEIAEITKYFRAACPDAILVNLEPRADYSVIARWYGVPSDKETSWRGWAVFLTRKGSEQISFKQGSADAMETFRQTCAAIRDDMRDVAEFDRNAAPMTTGRYVLHSVDPEHVFLVDTKTGAVWQLKELGRIQQFERVSVEGLYDNNPPGIRP